MMRLPLEAYGTAADVTLTSRLYEELPPAARFAKLTELLERNFLTIEEFERQMADEEKTT